MGFPGSLDGKESTCNAEDLGSIPGLGRCPWRREVPTLVFWPGEFHGLYSPWGHKELDTTEHLSLTHSSLLTVWYPPIILFPFIFGEDFYSRSQENEKEVGNIFKMLKEKNCQLRILYITKIPFRNEGEIKKSVSGERKLRELISSKPPTLRELLKDVLLIEGSLEDQKWRRSNITGNNGS